jgi:hypothetical protein
MFFQMTSDGIIQVMFVFHEFMDAVKKLFDEQVPDHTLVLLIARIRVSHQRSLISARIASGSCASVSISALSVCTSRMALRAHASSSARRAALPLRVKTGLWPPGSASA